MAGTVLTVGALGACAALSLGLAVVGAAGAASQRVAGAADAAALAAADAASGAIAGVPCERAEQVARANRVELVACHGTALVMTVTVAASFAGMTVTAAARAGPAL